MRFEHRADGPVDVRDVRLERDGILLFDGVGRGLDEVAVELVLSSWSCSRIFAADVAARIRQHFREVDLASLRMVDVGALFQDANPPDHLVDGLATKFGHDLAQLWAMNVM